MHPRIFVVAIAVAAVFGFLLGRCTAPGVRASSYTDAPHSLAPEPEHHPTVDEVTDGDTLVVLSEGSLDTRDKVRLLAIDTPERGQNWYAEARLALAELVRDKKIKLEFEVPGKPNRDKYGRVLAYVIADGFNANVEMVRRGWTPYVPKYGGNRYERELIAAEEEARVAHRGIWASR